MPNNTSVSVCKESDSIIEKYGDFNKIVVKLHPVHVQNAIIERGVVSNRVALQNDNALKLCDLSRVYSKDNTYKIIELWLLDLSEYIGVKIKLSSDQIQQMAILFYSEAYCLNMTELGLFFNRVKKGVYGDFYGSVDPIRIMSFLNTFLKDRLEAIERINKEKEIELRNQADIDWNNRKSEMSADDYEKITETINNFIKQMKF